MSRAATTSSAEGVAALDRLSERLLADAPLRVAVARGADERAAVFALRHAQVVRAGCAPLPGAEERDAYDEDAILIGAWDADRLAGTVRVVLPEPGRRLPVEAAFGITVEPVGAVAEAGRLVISPAYRGDPAHRTCGALLALAWRSLRARDCAVLAGAASPGMLRRLRAFGLLCEVLGAARPYWGEERRPIRLDPAQLAREAERPASTRT
jgi:hypothetical protein